MVVFWQNIMKEHLKFREIINQLMEKIGHISENKLAGEIGMPQQTIHRLLSGATPDPRISTLKPIAKYFDITIGQLIGDEPIKSTYGNNNHDLKTYVQIPLMHWEQVKIYENTVNELNHTNWIDWISTNLPVSKSAYALKISDKSLPTPFLYNTIIIVDPEIQPADNDVVVAYDKETDSAYLRRLFYEGKKQFIGSLKEGMTNTELNENVILSGTLVQVQTVLKDFNHEKSTVTEKQDE